MEARFCVNQDCCWHKRSRKVKSPTDSWIEQVFAFLPKHYVHWDTKTQKDVDSLTVSWRWIACMLSVFVHVSVPEYEFVSQSLQL